MRPRHQNGQVEIRSDGKGQYYCGRYTIYVKDQTGKEARKQPRPFLGYCSEISQSEASDRLQKLIRESQTKSVEDMDKAHLQFWNQREYPQSNTTDDWRYVRCSRCDGKSTLAYNTKTREFIAICENCTQFTRLAEIDKP